MRNMVFCVPGSVLKISNSLFKTNLCNNADDKNPPTTNVIKIKNCNGKNGAYGAYIENKSSDSVPIVFEHCTWQNCKILLSNTVDKVTKLGGVEFIDCKIIDDQNIPAVSYCQNQGNLYEIHGDIYVQNPHRAKEDLYDWRGAKLHNVDIILHSDYR